MIFRVVAISFLLIFVLPATFITGSYYGALHLYAINANGEASLIARTAQSARNGKTQVVIENLERDLDRRILESSWRSDILDKFFESVGFYEGGQEHLSESVINYRIEHPCSSPAPEVCYEVNNVINSYKQK